MKVAIWSASPEPQLVVQKEGKNRQWIVPFGLMRELLFGRETAVLIKPLCTRLDLLIRVVGGGPALLRSSLDEQLCEMAVPESGSPFVMLLPEHFSMIYSDYYTKQISHMYVSSHYKSKLFCSERKIGQFVLLMFKTVSVG